MAPSIIFYNTARVSMGCKVRRQDPEERCVCSLFCVWCPRQLHQFRHHMRCVDVEASLERKKLYLSMCYTYFFYYCGDVQINGYQKGIFQKCFLVFIPSQGFTAFLKTEYLVIDCLST